MEEIKVSDELAAEMHQISCDELAIQQTMAVTMRIMDEKMSHLNERKRIWWAKVKPDEMNGSEEKMVYNAITKTIRRAC